ncbi:agmatinase [Hyaloraphidium curvatum]|nr:agmatinase [Hyaloraphidium curvatum]
MTRLAILAVLGLAALCGPALARPAGDAEQEPVAVPAPEPGWAAEIPHTGHAPDDDLLAADDNNDILNPRRQTYNGIATFAHLPLENCLRDGHLALYDIAVIGIPYDIAVSYRPGARFGPNGIRQGSRRIQEVNAYDVAWGFNPFREGLRIVDCGDIPVSPYSTPIAFDQMTRGYRSLIHRHAATPSLITIPKIVVLGGDHAITLPVLRALREAYGRPVAVIHFDSHIDSWAPPASAPEGERWYHGSMFYHAHKEGLTAHGKNVHVGIRTRYWGVDEKDIREDESYGWHILTWYEIWKNGTEAAAAKIREIVGEDTPIYLSLDIDVINPGEAPATGTPEPGGLLTREVQDLVRLLRGLPIVAADLVEVSPAYDGPGEVTQITAANLAFDFAALLVDLAKRGKEWEEKLVGEEALRRFRRRRDARVGRRAEA